MVNRINLLLKAKNISARQFAEEIGIQPSGMSHILSGRNNPSLDFVMKVIKRWPEVNINWLMFGQGEMFAGLPLSVQSPSTPVQSVSAAKESQNIQADLFAPPAINDDSRTGDLDIENNKNVSATNADNEVVTSRDIPQSSSAPTFSPVMDPVNTQPHENRLEISIQEPTPLQTNVVNESVVPSTGCLPRKKIVKMIVLYDDHSFSEYFPE